MSKPIRYAQVNDKKKSLAKWIKQLILAQFPYQGIRDDECSLSWMWRPHIPSRFEFNLGPPLQFGDAGYEDAEYEVGFLIAQDGFKRMTPE